MKMSSTHRKKVIDKYTFNYALKTSPKFFHVKPSLKAYDIRSKSNSPISNYGQTYASSRSPH